MPLREPVVILPGPSLEDLPTRVGGEEAAELLAAWTLPWDPRLVAQAGRLPVWRPAGAPIEDLRDRLILLPGLSREAAPAGWPEQLKADLDPGRVVTQLVPRRDALDRILSPVADSSSRSISGDVAQLAVDLAPDFFALALTSLVVELIGYTMHYTSNVDRDALEEAAVAAAVAACEGDAALAEEKLQRAFDLLGQARDYYYPVESFFLDVTLLAPSVWGRPLIRRLERDTPTSVLVTAAQVRGMAASAPESMAALRRAVEDRKTTLIGGGMDDTDQTHESLETMLEDFTASRRVFEEHFGRPPGIYGRFQGGYSPLLPSLLDGLGYAAALLVAFDGSQLPKAEHSRFRWEGADGSAIDALGLVPGDAGDAGSLLRLADRLGQSMQHDHVATVLFASWPECESEFYEDLRRAAKRCPTLGRFVTVDEYFDATHGSDTPAMFDADEFRSPAHDPESTAGSKPTIRELRKRVLHGRELDRNRLFSGMTALVAPTASRDDAAAEAISDCVERLARVVCPGARRPHPEGVRAGVGSPRAAEPGPAGGMLAINLAAHSRTICFPTPSGKPIANGPAAPDRHVSDVPGMGFAWQADGHTSESPVPRASGEILRNEYFEVHINRETGGIGAIHEYNRRRNRLSQQLAVRLAGAYTRMVADHVRVTAATSACGEITSTGRLVDARGSQVAHFRQTTRLLRASRLIEVAVELTSLDAARLEDDRSYAAIRWAWRDEPAELRRSVHGASVLTKRKRVHAADFIDVVEDDGRMAIFTAGPIEHVQVQENRLDTLVPLRPGGTDAEECHVAVGIDLEEAAGTWVSEWHAPPLAALAPGVPVADRAWWFLCGSRSVRWTALGPLPDGRSGFSARLQELTGRYVKARIESFRPIRAARKTNLRGEPRIELPVRDGRIELQMAGYQWIQIEAVWE